ncbi:MAG: cobalamin-dependent protein, partial [Coriobacteriales bacterium]|nr:cobalamin-dependent protein [Coriobacteriales bacterium]
MRVLFVYLDFMIGAGGKYYEGLASLSAMLKQDKHQVDLLHITELLTVDDFTQRLLREYKDADVIGFSATTNVFPHVVEYSESIKKALPNTLVVCGGPHPTLAPEESIAAPGLDVICLGEGEYSLSELCNRLQIGVDFSDIEGLWVKQNGTVYRNPRRPFIQNLDDLPLPDRELFTFEGSADQAMDRLAFMGSRGCPYNCTHCCNHAFKKAATEGGGGG